MVHWEVAVSGAGTAPRIVVCRVSHYGSKHKTSSLNDLVVFLTSLLLNDMSLAYCNGLAVQPQR